MATLFTLPRVQALDTSGEPLMGASLTFTATGSSTPLGVYADEALTTPLPNPCYSDAYGVFPAIWLGPDLYRVKLTDAFGVELWSVDNVGSLPSMGMWAGTASGTGNAVVLTPDPAVDEYYAGLQITYLSASANTGATTVAVSGLTAKAVTKNGATALSAGDIPANTVITITYDGTQFQIGPRVLDGYTAADFAKLALVNYYTAGQIESTETLTYGATVSVGSPAAKNYCILTVTNGNGFTIANPSFTDSTIIGHRLELTIRNTSGGAMGLIIWGDKYKMSAWTNPANGFSRSIAFRCNGTNWVQVSQTGVDVPN